MNDNFIFEVSFVTLLSKLIAKISSSLEKAMLTSYTFSPLYHQLAQSTQKHLLVYSQRDISGPRKPNKKENQSNLQISPAFISLCQSQPM